MFPARVGEMSRPAGWSRSAAWAVWGKPVVKEAGGLRRRVAGCGVVGEGCADADGVGFHGVGVGVDDGDEVSGEGVDVLSGGAVEVGDVEAGPGGGVEGAGGACGDVDDGDGLVVEGGDGFEAGEGV